MGERAEITRDEQMARAVALTEQLRDQGWTKASVSVSRGGTLRIDVEAGESAARPAWGSGKHARTVSR